MCCKTLKLKSAKVGRNTNKNKTNEANDCRNKAKPIF